MLYRSIDRRLGLAVGQACLLGHFLCLAVSVMAFSVLGYTIASSLFLAHAGPENIPLAYMLVGLLSIPLYAWFSQIVDSTSRPRLFQYLSLASGAAVLLLRMWVHLESLPSYYAIYIAFYFQWVLYIDILFPCLVSDYFTTLEFNRYSSFFSIAMGVGALLGGGITQILSIYFTPEDILLFLPLAYGINGVHLLSLEGTHRQIEEKSTESEIGIRENIKTLIPLMRRYPIVPLLLASSVLFIVLFSLSEFLYFSIYSREFADDRELTGFLGLTRIAGSILQLAVTFLCTRPLLDRLGVSRMNLLYPLTTLASFAGLSVNCNLPAAVAANINNDFLHKAIDQPIYTLNYNAVPHRFVGRVRAISEGLFSSLGLSLAGILLWAIKNFFTTFQITKIGILLSFVFFGTRYLIGKSYLQSLLVMLRSGSVEIDEVSEGLVRLPAAYTDEVSQLLTSNDRDEQLLGVELACRMENAAWFLGEVQELLPRSDATVRRAVVRLFSNFQHANFTRYLRILLDSDSDMACLVALEALIARRELLSDVELRGLLARSHSTISALACVAASAAGCNDAQVKITCQKFWGATANAETQLAIVRVLRDRGDRALMALLLQITANSPSEVKQEGLDALAILARPGDVAASAAASAEILHPSPSVRAAALQLLGVVRDASLLPQVARGLEDDSPEVRERAALALGAHGEGALDIVRFYLESQRPEVVEASIAAIARVRTRQAEEILFKYLNRDYRSVAASLEWLRQLRYRKMPVLEIAIRDFHQRLLRRVLHVLASLGCDRTVNNVQRLLCSTDVRSRANAVETLASLQYRRFVMPILPLLEHPDAAILKAPRRDSHRLLLEETLSASDRWIRMASLWVLGDRNYPIPAAALEDADPLVRAVALHVSLPPQQRLLQENFFMKHLLLLKNISLFHSLSLDDLLRIDKALKSDEFLAGETIFAEGSIGQNFYIIGRGRVRILKQINRHQQELAQLTVGDYFGEMALFDEEPQSVTALADTDCTLLTLGKGGFQSLIAQRPEIVSQMCKVLIVRLREADAQLAKILQSGTLL